MGHSGMSHPIPTVSKDGGLVGQRGIWDRHWGLVHWTRIIPSCPMVNKDRMDSLD